MRTIDTTKMHAPSFLMVLTGVGDYAYRRFPLRLTAPPAMPDL